MQRPEKIPKSKLVIFNQSLAREIGLDELFFQSEAELRALADYTINRHFKEMRVRNQENIYLAWLREVVKRQAELVAKWQLVGFIHGVMNTDNMTISGETIDYGPCAFMDAYDLKPFLVQLMNTDDMLTGINPLLEGGILHDLLSH